MRHSRKLRVLAAALLVALIVPSVAFAQEPEQKQNALTFYKVQETNPLLKPMQASPKRMVTVGGIIDVAGVSAWNLTMGPKHDKLAAAGLWTMTAFRVYLALHNHLNEHRAERR